VSSGELKAVVHRLRGFALLRYADDSRRNSCIEHGSVGLDIMDVSSGLGAHAP
jgi:hypothetical protein